MAAKTRLDELLVTRGLANSRTQAQRLVMAGEVLLGDRPAAKPGQLVPADAELALRQAMRYVSRGGLKLEAALHAFAIEPSGWVCADIGASTGGFTDCLLQHGAARVYAIDVGYGQLAWSLRQDPRVVNIERVNIRYLEQLPEAVRLATVDVSFIGLSLVLPKVVELVDPEGSIVALIKPQFEAGRDRVGKGGVVRDPAVHRAVIGEVLGAAAALGLFARGLIRSPITGPAGNVEFLAQFQRGARLPASEVESWIELALQKETAADEERNH